ncbi:hypothetical protein C922_04518 [Plasmodium inui San Antonio 1]|uniref:FAD-binding domain-containing protein n=1 Tax=Plasmodium inui San Antonio 1 TaxID=1237626 RepID=W7A1C1_9APIC|nr:hypothetical protein C922_04518 [Plasmodium inui San Antonio 1]EUD65118.1 hypothetical protein C922_04518 [Plasmodium inui San Antonio 1]
MSRLTNGYLRKRDPPEEEHQKDVLIVGANTGGLLLSLDLARKNVNHLVINSCDRNREGINGEDISEQYLLYPRTLEIFHDLNILSEVRNRSLKLTGVSFYVGNRLINQTDKTFFQNCNGSTSYMLSISKTTLNNILRRKVASINSDAVQDGTILWGLSQNSPPTSTGGNICRKDKGAADLHAHLDHKQRKQHVKGRRRNGRTRRNQSGSWSDVKKLYTLPSLLKRRQGKASGHLVGEKKREKKFTPRGSQHSSSSSSCSEHEEKYTTCLQADSENSLDRYRIHSSSSDTVSSFSTTMQGDHSGNSTCENGFFQRCVRCPLNGLPTEGHRKATPTVHVRLVEDTKRGTKQHTGNYIQVPQDRKKQYSQIHSTIEPIVGKRLWRRGFFFGGQKDTNGAVEKNAHNDLSVESPATNAPTRVPSARDTHPSEDRPGEDLPKKPLNCSIRSKFIVGVDGRKSSIRKLANIKMEEKTSQPIEYISVDVCAKWNIDMSHYNLTLVQSEHGFTTCFPILTDMRNIYKQNFYCNDQAFGHFIERTKEEYSVKGDLPESASSLKRVHPVGRVLPSFGGKPTEDRGATKHPRKPCQPCPPTNGLAGTTAKEAPHRSGSESGIDPGGDEDWANWGDGPTAEGGSKRESKRNPQGGAQDEPVQTPIGKHPRDRQKRERKATITDLQRLGDDPTAPSQYEDKPDLITPTGAHAGKSAENGVDPIGPPSRGTSECLSSGEPQNGHTERGNSQSSGGTSPEVSQNSVPSEEVSIEEDPPGWGQNGAPQGHPVERHEVRDKTDGDKWRENHVAGMDRSHPSKPNYDNQIEGRDASAWGRHPNAAGHSEGSRTRSQSSDSIVGEEQHDECPVGEDTNDGNAFPKGEEDKCANGEVRGAIFQGEKLWGSPREDGPEMCATNGTPPKRKRHIRSDHEKHQSSDNCSVHSTDHSKHHPSDNTANLFSDAVSNNSGETAPRNSALSIRRGGYNWHLTICRRANRYSPEELICRMKQTNKLHHMEVIHLIEKIFPGAKIFYIYNLKRGIHRDQMCQEFYRQGIILAGESNCLYNPMFSISINLTVHDVYCIGWKLKYLIDYNSSPILLDEYQKERQYISQKVLSWSSEMIHFVFLLNNIASYYFALFLNCCSRTISRFTSTSNVLDRLYKKTFMLQSDYYRLGLVHTSAQLTSRHFMCGDRPRNCVLRCVTLYSNTHQQNNTVRLYDYLGCHAHTLILCIGLMNPSRICACKMGLPKRCPHIMNPFSSKGWAGSSHHGCSHHGCSHHDADAFLRLTKIGRLTYGAMARGRHSSALSILWVVCGGEKNDFARGNSIVSAGTDTNGGITRNGNALSAILSVVCPQMMHRATIQSRNSPLNCLLTKIRSNNNPGRQTILYDFMSDFQRQLNIKLGAPCVPTDLCRSRSAMYIFVRPDMHITHMNYVNDENKVTAFIDYVYRFYG